MNQLPKFYDEHLKEKFSSPQNLLLVILINLENFIKSIYDQAIPHHPLPKVIGMPAVLP